VVSQPVPVPVWEAMLLVWGEGRNLNKSITTMVALSFVSMSMGMLLCLALLYTTQAVVIRVELEDEREGWDSHGPVNNRPIIGVLSQELDEFLVRKLPPGHNYTSYIASSYIKWVEAGGARAVPVIIGKSREYYVELFSYLNGILYPGGSAPLVGDGGYAEVGQLFFELAKASAESGDPFPIWGTCNGFELLTVLSSRDISRLTTCNSEDQASPLKMLPKAPDSLVYGQAPPHILRELETERVSINFHHFCLTPTNFTRYHLDRFWNDLTVNWDRDGLKYLSTLEAKRYPFTAVQFHPEKNIFEWAVKEPKIPHSREAVGVSLYFATHFVNQCRRNMHRFPDRTTEESFLIYNYRPKYVGKEDIDWSFQEAYLF